MGREPSKTVLMLNANPRNTSPARLDEEAREIRAKLREANLRDLIRLESLWAIRPGDILQGLNQYEPDIVHFSGHGTGDDEIVVESPTGDAQTISGRALVALFEESTTRPQAVVLNSCFTSRQAEKIARYVEITIGMSAPIGIEAAVVFSAAFYSALGYGKSYEVAFGQARTSLLLHGIEEDRTPALFFSDGTDPRDLTLVRADEAQDPERGSLDVEQHVTSVTSEGDFISTAVDEEGERADSTRVDSRTKDVKSNGSVSIVGYRRRN